MRKLSLLIMFSTFLFTPCITNSATVVPNDIKQPGTQPTEVSGLESPNKCGNCHGGYDSAVEPSHNWMGSMMANAGRDPIFWATVAIAEQDFDGAGDLCIRCHSTTGWLAGRSTPTDGSGLAVGDSNGVDCDFCHKMTNPDNSEHVGVQFSPFIANDGGTPATAYYGSGMASLWGGSEKLGPFSEPAARHQFMQSQFHRSVDFCGTCHDVSNAVVGDLAHNNGKQDTADPVVSSGVPGAPVDGKAAFNNFPYKYGIVERTFSEYKSGLLPETLVSDYANLPSDLQEGAIMDAYNSAIIAGTGGNYEDGASRYFSCQTCHLRPVQGLGCNKNGVPFRNDLPLHDMTGGNYWMPEAIQYLDLQGKLRLGGGLTAAQIAAMNDGINRAKQQLNGAVSLTVNNNIVKVVNLTGHKVISGYPEGRRMWLNIKWYDINDNLIGEDGAYGQIGVTVPNPAGGPDIEVKSIIDLNDPNTKIYEAHYAMTQTWATQLLALGKPVDFPLNYDRETGAVDFTLGALAGQAQGTYHETFHFVLNNKVVKDNRIPPYGMRYDNARVRNALPVPADQYGNPGPGGTYNYWDEVSLNPPIGAEYATIDMLYQPTSWEYIQFLYLANTGSSSFLANEGIYMLDAWLNNGMAQPYVMASAAWTAPPPPVADANGPYSGVAGQAIDFDGSGSTGSIVLYEWDIDNDGTYDYSSASPSQSHIYALQGAYTIKLRVTDILSRTDEATTTATISPPVYTLTVSITGSGTVTSLPAGINCSPDCDEAYTGGTPVTLTAIPSGGFVFTGWSGDPDCSDGTVTMDSAKNCSAAFQACSDRLVWVEDAIPEFYTSIQNGYIAAADGKTIMVQAEAFTEDLNFNLNKTVTLMGGYNCDYSSVIGATTVNGNFTVSNGTIIIGDFIFSN